MHNRLWMTTALVVTMQLPPGSAYAHDRYRTGTVKTGNGYCVVDTALMREDARTQDGVARGAVRSRRADCNTPINRDVQHLAQRIYVYFRPDGSTPNQYLCVYTDWAYNLQPTSGFWAELKFPDRAYCGTGLYEVEIVGHVFIEGSWRGGIIRSTEHLLNA
jgi:hypothetical protein